MLMRMTRSVITLVLVGLVVAAPGAIAQTPPPPPPPSGPTLPDPDGDGFVDAADQCPNTPGPVNGCPDPDVDHDGFPNESDRCPTVPGSIKGCPTDPDAGTGDNSEIVLPTATSVSGLSASLHKSGGALMLSGVAFIGAPSQSVMTPRRLTIWLPKGIIVSGAPAKPCSRAFARNLTLGNSKRCAKIFGGRLGGNSDITGWFAWAGPKQGAKHRLWLRGRSGDDLVGFGTGWIEPVKGAFRTKITLELGQLGIDTRGLEVYSGAERTTAGWVRPFTGRCSGSFRMRLDSAQGSATKKFRC
jgi:Thrombospondin type 3 repeat